jgi:hypothetical protein
MVIIPNFGNNTFLEGNLVADFFLMYFAKFQLPDFEQGKGA